MNEKTNFDINFAALLHSIAKRIWVIILSAVLAAGLVYAYIAFLVQPQYSSTATLYIGSSTGPTSYGDVNLSDFLAKDYEVIIKRRAVLDDVVRELNLNVTATQLRNYVSVTNVSDTRILDITVSTPDAELSKKIADTICTVASDKLVSIIKVDYVSIVDSGSISSTPSNINLPVSMVLGALAGVLISVFCIMVRTLMDDKIKTPDDVEHYLGLSVLGTTPFSKDLGSEFSKSSMSSLKRKFLKHNKKSSVK